MLRKSIREDEIVIILPPLIESGSTLNQLDIIKRVIVAAKEEYKYLIIGEFGHFKSQFGLIFRDTYFEDFTIQDYMKTGYGVLSDIHGGYMYSLIKEYKL